MMNMKKTLALLLAAVMVLGMFPFGAMAEETPVCTCTPAEDGTHAETCALYAAPVTPASEEPKQETPVCTCTPADDGTHAETCALYEKPVTPAAEEPKQETPVCTCTPAEDGTHAETCALYEKPQEPKQEQPTCTCTPAEDGTHAETCALYEKPQEPKQEQPTCTCTPAEDGTHAEDCALYEKPEAPVCTCTPVDGVHEEECALYKAPEEEPAPEMTEQEVEELYNALMACDTLESINAAAEKITEEKAEYFFNALTEEQIKELTDHFLVIFEEVYPSKEPVTQESVIVYPTVSNTNAAPFLKPVKAAPIMRLFAFKAAPVAEETFDNGLQLDKNVSAPNKDGVYTLTLDAYATGSKTITEETKAVPTDIILVLDQSGSMAYDFTVTNYIPFKSSDPEDHYQQQLDSLYVKLTDGFYASVIVKKNVELTSPKSVSGKSNSEYHGMNGKLYHQCSADSYGILSCEKNYYVLYLYTCENCGATSYGINIFVDITTPNNNDEFYTADSATTKYTFSYVDQNGQTVVSGPATTVPDGWEFYEAGTGSTNTRLAALKTAVETFTTNVKNKAETDNVNHRIAIVGFASVSGNGNNSEVLTLTGRNSGSVGISYSELTSDDDNYEGALQDMSTANGQSMVNNAVAALAAQGATRVDVGMEMANKIFEKNPIPAGEERNRVIIVFTDGVPTTSNSYSDTVATSAINYGNAAKNTYGATVYTVGIFDGADSTKDGSNSGNASETQKANWFMHRLSSNTNYPQSPSYYLTASNSADLNKIFQEISQNIETGGSSITLDEEAVVKDVITDQFVLPSGTNPSQIKVYTANCTGVDANGKLTFGTKAEFTDAIVDINGQTVTVKNFDFAENWCGTETVNTKPTYRGNKLVIEIPIKVRNGFLGGNNVLTNGEGSGVYENSEASEAIEKFVSPTVDVQIGEVEVTAPDYNVYLLGGVDAATLESGLTVKSGEVVLDMAKGEAKNYGLEDWQSAYVTINAGDNLAALTNMTADATYSASVTIEPNNPTGEAKAKSGTDTGNVYVWVPSLIYKDTVHDYLSEEPTYDTNNKVGAMTWGHNTDTYNAENMLEETVPTVALSYAPVSGITDGKITSKDHVPVNVTAKIGDVDVTSYVVFNHQDCDFTNCPYDEDGSIEFYLHVINVSADLTIIKAGVESQDGNAPFVFNVKGSEVDMNVVIYGNNSVTIKELPADEYTVTEVSGYWRYDISKAKYSSTTADLTDGNKTVTVTNTRVEDKWLDDWAKATNNFS